MRNFFCVHVPVLVSLCVRASVRESDCACELTRECACLRVHSRVWAGARVDHQVG
jgi:hypothetical protein